MLCRSGMATALFLAAAASGPPEARSLAGGGGERLADGVLAEAGGMIRACLEFRARAGKENS